ncbi:hypothetical protein BMW23_0263 [Bodo saltans virus]|jgi:translation initiation factor 1 (eIF-1/SUI1)|uniref:SUI1 domain-containing protein n=1 Tax=Bodo saltans virus TaxID=2024608 RepID=A0A2H4UTR1_9VIRU|nr:hypothetical protein QJ851_gp0258 [Bodo saltans virus]ATZ80321.1 hypothetical protein BMW23_0263 [Bodo saltans virus]
MDSFDQNKKQTKIKDVDNKITIRYIKEGRSKRTFISGLHFFIKQEEITKLISTFQKKLGSGVVAEKDILEKDDSETTNTIDAKMKYGFQGDHTDMLTTLVMATGKFKKDDIVCIK